MYHTQQTKLLICRICWAYSIEYIGHATQAVQSLSRLQYGRAKQWCHVRAQDRTAQLVTNVQSSYLVETQQLGLANDEKKKKLSTTWIVPEHQLKYLHMATSHGFSKVLHMQNLTPYLM
jgi:hypothetical protein